MEAVHRAIRPDKSTFVIGREAEAFAARVLADEGYHVIAHNVRAHRAELDIIAWHEDTLCFVEVRSTKTLEHGGPLATIGPTKQRQVVHAAKLFLAQHPELSEAAMRFDAIGIWGEGPMFEHVLIQGAFVAGSRA
jgi:putative endonuclease